MISKILDMFAAGSAPSGSSTEDRLQLASAALLFLLAVCFERELLRAEEESEKADAKGKAPMHVPTPPAPPRGGDGEAAPAAANDALLEQLMQSQFGKIALVQLYRVPAWRSVLAVFTDEIMGRVRAYSPSPSSPRAHLPLRDAFFHNTFDSF